MAKKQSNIIFDINNMDNISAGVLKQKTAEEEYKESKNLSDAKNAQEDLKHHQKVIEHFTGYYDLINFISKMKTIGAKIHIQNNIIYLDSIASSNFFMIPSFTTKIRKRIDGQMTTVEHKYNPSITCKYDFIHLILWKTAYIYQDRLYLVAYPQHSETVQMNGLKFFTLSILCNMPEKFEIFNDFSEVDFRKIKFDLIEDEDENGHTIQTVHTQVEKNYIEQSIKCMILNDSNSYLINQLNAKEMEEEHKKYRTALTMKADDRMGSFFQKYQGLMTRYNIQTTCSGNEEEYRREKVQEYLKYRDDKDFKLYDESYEKE